MAKVRTRSLTLRIKYKIPQDVSEEKILRTLKDSIRRGDYEIPRNWRVVIEWNNYDRDTEPRRGDWTPEMKRSAKSSPGFDRVVTNYLDMQLEKL